MEDLVKQLSEKTGIARDKAEQVSQFLKEHAADAPQWINTEQSKLATLLSERTGLARADAEKVIAHIKANGGDWAKSLGQRASDMAHKAEGAVAGLFGKK